jgi:hypothetical protein
MTNMSVVHLQTRARYETSAVCAVFEVLTAVSLNIQVFWDVTSRGLVNGYRPFEGSYCLHLHTQTVDDPEDEGTKIVQSVGNSSQAFTA